MKPSSALSLALALGLCGGQALAEQSSLRDMIAASLDAGAEVELEAQVEVKGVQNCWNKCQNLFDNTAYAIQTVGGLNTYEYLACLAGCNICGQVQSSKTAKASDCFDTCKDTDWTQMTNPTDGSPVAIVKGVVEPDKACIFGCIIQTCQYVCNGGTTDQKVTKANAAMWWDPPKSTGCSIKTGAVREGGYYAQNSNYNYWNSPSGAGGQDSCCSNAFNLCNYKGNKKSANYKNGLAQAQRECASVQGAGNTAASICAYFNNKQNCGSSVS
jgi:hypothetical protein